MKTKLIIFLWALLTAACALAQPKKASPITDRQIVRAYQYTLARMLTLRQELIDLQDGFRYNEMRYDKVEDVSWANPNLDVVYLEAWIGLDEKSPVIIEVPSIEGRYYTVQLLDPWGETVLNINERTFPQKTYGKYALCLKGQKYNLPSDVTRVDVPVKKLRLLGRIELKGDPEGAVALQKQFRLYSMGKPVIDEPVNIPLFDNASLMGAELFEYAPKVFTTSKDPMPEAMQNQLLTMAISLRMRRDEAFRERVEQVISQIAVPSVHQGLLTAGTHKGEWNRADVIGTYGNDYLERTIVSLAGIWANTKDEAVYFIGLTERDGQPLNGSNAYEIRFDKDNLPKDAVNAFWSVVVLDTVDYRVSENPLKRYVLNNISPLVYEPDGSLVIVFAPTLPEGYHETNWLPTPQGKPFTTTFRCYVPKKGVTEGRWFVPPLTKIK